MKARGSLLAGLGATGCVALAVLLRRRAHFDWQTFLFAVRELRWRGVLLATGLIYLSVCLRGLRWSTLLRPTKVVASTRLIGPQFIGFTCVALFGSVGDLVRPYLLARAAKLPVSSQMATYTIERMFDLVSAALLFSGALALTPRAAGEAHRGVFLHVGTVSLMGTVAILGMAVAMRRYGELLAGWTDRGVSRVSPRLGMSAGVRLRAFRDGLGTIESVRELAEVLGISLAIWGLVALAYVAVVHSFVRTPELAGLGFSETMLLVAAGIGGSLVQLPVVGWFTQIAATAATMHAIFGVPTEAATACGALLLAVTFLFLIPGGLIFAHFARLSLRAVVRETGSE